MEKFSKNTHVMFFFIYPNGYSSLATVLLSENDGRRGLKGVAFLNPKNLDFLKELVEKIHAFS